MEHDRIQKVFERMAPVVRRKVEAGRDNVFVAGEFRKEVFEILHGEPDSTTLTEAVLRVNQALGLDQL